MTKIVMKPVIVRINNGAPKGVPPIGPQQNVAVFIHYTANGSRRVSAHRAQLAWPSDPREQRNFARKAVQHVSKLCMDQIEAKFPRPWAE